MTITALDTALAILHDRGQLNETAFAEVCAELLDTGLSPTREQLGRIFGSDKIWWLCTIPDATARQLVQEAADALFNPETRIDLRDWLQTAQAIVGPITFGRAPAQDAIDRVAAQQRAHEVTHPRER